MRIFGRNIVSAEQEAWFILNLEAPADQRRVKGPEEWYTCVHWKSMGQKPVICQYLLEHTAAMMPNTQREYAVKVAQAYYRLNKIMTHHQRLSRM